MLDVHLMQILQAVKLIVSFNVAHHAPHRAHNGVVGS